MFTQILKFFLKDIEPKAAPISVKAISPGGDYNLYLLNYRNDLYVILEADYPPLTSAIKDIETSFSVTVEGWVILRKYQQEASKRVLPVDSFSSDIANETDENWQSYKLCFYVDNGMKYALLKVASSEETAIALRKVVQQLKVDCRA